MPCKILITVRTGEGQATSLLDVDTCPSVVVGLPTRRTRGDASVRLEYREGQLLLDVLDGVSNGAAPLIVPQETEFATTLRLGRDGLASVYVRPYARGMGTFAKYGFAGDCEFEIGRGPKAGIRYANTFISAHHVRVSYFDGVFSITDLGSANGTFVNGRQLPRFQPWWLNTGDVVQVLDLIVAVGGGFLCLNNPPGSHLFLPNAGYVSHQAIREACMDVVPESRDPEAFHPAARVARFVKPVDLRVEDPPRKVASAEQSTMARYGPSFAMGIGSVALASGSIAQIASGGSAVLATPSIAAAAAMIGGSAAWPAVSRTYGRTRDERSERQRSNAYAAYLDGVGSWLLEEANEQAQILRENRASVAELMAWAASLSPLLMSRTSMEPDFLDLRVGVGDAGMQAHITWPEENSLQADGRMLDYVVALSNDLPVLRDVPLAFNPIAHPTTGIVGPRRRVWKFVRGLIVQVCALYSWRDVRIVLVGGVGEEDEWDFLKSLGHFYDDGGARRNLALTRPGLEALDLFMRQRLGTQGGMHGGAAAEGIPHYLVLCADAQLARCSEVVQMLLRSREAKGVSALFLGEGLHGLPRGCDYVIDVSDEWQEGMGYVPGVVGEDWVQQRGACMYEVADVLGTMATFEPDVMVGRADARNFAHNLARVHLADAGAGSAASWERGSFVDLLDAEGAVVSRREVRHAVGMGNGLVVCIKHPATMGEFEFRMPYDVTVEEGAALMAHMLGERTMRYEASPDVDLMFLEGDATGTVVNPKQTIRDLVLSGDLVSGSRLMLV